MNLPNKLTYMKYIYQNDFDKDIFFKTLYDLEKDDITKKSDKKDCR